MSSFLLGRMEKDEEKVASDQRGVEDIEEAEALELVLFQVSECYVYLVKNFVYADMLGPNLRAFSKFCL